MKHARAGSALLIILCFLGIIAALTQQLVKTSFLTIRMLNQEIKRTKAQLLAQNGLTLAIAELTQQLEPKKNTAEANPKIEALEKILIYLNKWQEFTLSNDLEGMQGTIKIYISCEEGKIPIQKLLDPSTKKISKAFQEFLKNINQSNEAKKTKDKTSELAAFLQKKDVPLEDPTQIGQFFELPLVQSQQIKKVKNTQKQPIALLDAFSLWNTTGKINPLFFSKSCCSLLKLKSGNPSSKDDKDQKDIYHRIAETVSKDWGSDWEKNWTTLTPLYGAKPQMPAETTALFSEAVEPTVFSVISCGIVQGIEQRLYAIIHKSNKTVTQEPQKNTEKKQIEGITFAKPETVCGVMRTYWIDQFNTYEEH